MSKSSKTSGGKRGSVMTTVGGKKNTNFSMYTGNIVSSGKQSGLRKGVVKKAAPGKVK